MNGDGLADVLIGADRSGPTPGTGIGYVVFGKADSATVDLAKLGVSGFQINGINTHDALGFSVSGAGDVNGDGLADLVIGASGASPGGGARSHR